MVGTLRDPWLTRVTCSAAASSRSISISVYGTPRAAKTRLARRQSPHHGVVYMKIRGLAASGDWSELVAEGVELKMLIAKIALLGCGERICSLQKV